MRQTWGWMEPFIRSTPGKHVHSHPPLSIRKLLIVSEKSLPSGKLT